jgi:hypothetical protein
LHVFIFQAFLSLGLVYSGASLLPGRYDDSGLLTAAATLAYCGLLTVSALASGTTQV